ncbi:uncharacterized protein FOMMEDRAFT_28788 [Fomitiporia mediterranea MF3/22]|uniref:uncharacterized protein n=1 Tax=Fomitiporia mediterranea (strain MF3/22) TaxID=694068 RepID=UPI0004408351|nr:uncharacterized protein FOMMEDRAFT_28788 [Fomitiporia mediterranea MF3/22]EJD03250.1 hypothetical protein FOMMEDRAFT_28788 [Fomitiporia mediterranea MF3/22]
MSWKCNTGKALTYPTYEADKTMYQALVEKSRTTDSISMLIELMELAQRNPEQFDRCEKISRDPFISFVEICAMQSKLSTNRGSRALIEGSQSDVSSLPDTNTTSIRRSFRVQERQKIELSRPLQGINFSEDDLASYTIAEDRKSNKRKRETTSMSKASEEECSAMTIDTQGLQPKVKRPYRWIFILKETKEKEKKVWVWLSIQPF